MSSQFDVYRHPDAEASETPYLVCLQSDLVNLLEFVVVAPLIPRTAIGAFNERLTPCVSFDNEQYLVVVPQLAAIPRHLLKTWAGNLGQERDPLLAAIDLLFTGI